MKKLIFLLLVGAMVTITYFTRPAGTELNNLLLENVEALAAGEGSGTVNCVGIGSVDCPRNSSKVYVVFEGYSLETLY